MRLLGRVSLSPDSIRSTFLLMEVGEINLGASLQYYNRPTQEPRAYGTNPYQLISYCTVTFSVPKTHSCKSNPIKSTYTYSGPAHEFCGAVIIPLDKCPRYVKAIPISVCLHLFQLITNAARTYGKTDEKSKTSVFNI